jgi:RHS repeat-associated protein
MSGYVIQEIHYAPFGEVISEYTPYWHGGKIPDYLFNAKELDEENGMYYYEARYYNPPMFISRDPLFEKKPFMSPYAYCANNPVKYIDPTGEDEYEFYKSGELKGVIENNEIDKIRIVDIDGQEIVASGDFKAGTIQNVVESDFSYGGSLEKMTSMTIKDDDQADMVFGFLAENTDVEWGHLKTGTDPSKYSNTISTSYSSESEVSALSLIGSIGQQNIRELSHSHPFDPIQRPYYGPSGGYHPSDYTPKGRGDNGVATAYPGIQQSVYDATKRTYYYYDQNKIYNTRRK